jgi:glutamate N-acetyltransferase/amino-acid N-acetyltransferase
MSSCQANNKKITIDDINSEEYNIVYDALYKVNESLAKQIVRDGEGATKLIECHVKGADSLEDARVLAKACINSNLVKTAFFGEDANWGRVVSSTGASGVEFDRLTVSVWFESENGNILLLDHGVPVIFDEDLAANILKAKEIKVIIDLEKGLHNAISWGCDLSYEYVTINADYRT